MKAEDVKVGMVVYDKCHKLYGKVVQVADYTATVKCFGKFSTHGHVYSLRPLTKREKGKD